MRCKMCFAFLLPLIALAGGKADLMKVQTVLNDGEYAGRTAPVFVAPRETHRDCVPTDPVGKIDTVGGTTYDWQVNGPCDQYIYVDPTYGVHVTWMYSAEMSGHSDRNMRYNFFDFAGGAWNFIDPTNFMNSGVSTGGQGSGFGMLDVNPVTGVAYVVAHQGSIFPNLARDAAPGAGIFDPCPGTPNADQYLWPSMNLTANEQAHVALIDNRTRFDAFYSKVDPWCTWSVPISVPNGMVPDPQFPTFILKGSKSPSGKVVISWDYSNTDPASPDEGYYRQSTDNGATWADPVQIPVPPAFTPGSETTATFHIAGVYPFLDHNDDLHVVANVGPIVNGTAYVMPAEIWHWFQPTNTWSKVVRAECDTTHLMGSVGYNALYAGRPTLCEGHPEELVCIWEEFDSSNVEPLTSLLRAEIREARSLDNGVTWGNAVTLTDPGTDSKRFPAVATRMYNDTVWIRYMADQVAGFGIAPYAQGPVTNNPVIVQRFRVGSSVSDDGQRSPLGTTLAMSPNPLRMSSTVSYELPKSGNVRLSVCDAAGRTVRVLADGTAGPGRYAVCWDGRGEHGAALRSGVYFCNLETGGTRLTRKVVLLP